MTGRDQGLAVFDGIGQALSLHGLSGNSGEDVNELHRHLPRTFARAGATVLNVDHVSKDREGRRFATGSQGKLRDVSGVSYLITSKVAFAPGALGASVLTVAKDRRGMVRKISNRKGVAGRFIMDARDGGLRLRVEPPSSEGEAAPGTDLTRAAAGILSVLHGRERPSSVREIQDAIVTEGVFELSYKRETVSRALNGELAPYVDCADRDAQGLKEWWRA